MIEGVIKAHAMSAFGWDNWLVKLNVQIINGPLADVELQGSLFNICSMLNAIPFKGKPITYHLNDSLCTLYFEDNAYHLLAVN